MSLRIAYVGGNLFACPALRKLALLPDCDIAFVVATPDRPAGRGMLVNRNPVAQAAKELGLTCHQPDTAEQLHGLIAGQQLDFCVVCAYGCKLLPDTLEVPRLGCVNIHPSLLPRWRGAAPIERALLAGDQETGVTTMLMSNRIDAGKIILKQPLVIDPHDTGGSLRSRLADLGAELVVTTLRQFTSLVPQPQDPQQTTYAAKLKKSEAQLDWHEQAVVVLRKVRALNPTPGAFTYLGEERVKILSAELANTQGAPGCLLTVSEHELIIACATDSIRLLQLQSPGKKVQTASAWWLGRSKRIQQGMHAKHG